MVKIKIAYRQIIDSKSTGDFERNVFNDSFNEFYMQAQAYNPDRKFKTIHELIQNNPKANSLHYKVGFSIGLYISGLKNTIPGLQDTLGQHLKFEDYQFEILHSDVTNKSSHKVSIVFISMSMDLMALSGGYLIVADPSKENPKLSTLTIQLQPNLSIIEWREVGEWHQETHEHEKQIN